MSFFNPDMVALLAVFQSETIDLMRELDDYLEQIKQNKKLNSDELNGIFRVVHTIKSSSAMMGLQELSKCTHRLEDLFLLFRNRPELCEQEEKRILHVMYDYADYVRDEIDQITEADYTPSPITSLNETIDEEIDYFNKKANGESTVSAEVKLQVLFKESCPLVNVRAFLLLKQIKPLCTSIKWIPEELNASDARDVIKEQGLQVFVVTEQLDKVRTKFEKSPYIEKVLLEEEKKEVSKAAEMEPTQKAAESVKNASTAKFCNLSWKSIMELQKLTEELIISNSLLENKIAKLEHARELEGVTQSFSRTLSELEELVSAAALTPVASVKTQLDRIVRDICKKEKKEVAFSIKGEEIEADKNLIDTMLNPLMHLIRNSIDHGIESSQERIKLGKNPCGQVELSVSIQDSTLIFSVRDDGCGIDSNAILESAWKKNLLHKDPKTYSREEIINLIFLPGFSTTKVANEFSGRGVGMDVVRNTIDSLGGVLSVKSEVGQGSTFIMQVPVSLTAVESMSFLVGDVTCLLPLVAIERVYSVAEAKKMIYSIDGKEFFQGSSLIPVLHMAEVFKLSEEEYREEHVMILKGIRKEVCIVTGAVVGQQTAVTKKLPPLFPQEFGTETGISGCVVIDEGALGFMLNLEKLIEMNREV